MNIRGKIVYSLFVFFAGVTTAIYFLVPVDKENTAAVSSDSFLKSDELAKNYSGYVQKALGFSKNILNTINSSGGNEKVSDRSPP